MKISNFQNGQPLILYLPILPNVAAAKRGRHADSQQRTHFCNLVAKLRRHVAQAQMLQISRRTLEPFARQLRGWR
jgi:hypothetical protein